MDIVTLAAARKSGGSGGDVTKQYVDEHLALKVDKVDDKGLSTNDYTNADKTKVANSPISSTASGTSFSLTDAADAPLAGLVIEGRTTSSAGTITNIGDNGLSVTSCGKNLFRNGTWYRNNDSRYSYTTDDSTNRIRISPAFAINKSGQVVISGIPSQYTIIALACYNSSKEFVQWTYFSDNTTTIPGGTAYIMLLLGGTNLTSDDNAILANANIQLELGSTATPYEPYKGSTAALFTGLPLCSVGDVKDTADFGKGIVTKRTKIENGEVVALDTPTELSMTASELATFHGLRTFENTTNITCTDSPQMTVDYLIDTDNGKAIGRLITTFSETILYQDDMGGTDVRQGTTIILSQAFTNFDEIIIEWGFTQNNYYEVFSNSWRASYWSQVKEYQANNPNKTVEINMNYYNGNVYTCFIPTADDKLYITAMGGGVSRYITKIIGRKYSAA